MNYPQIHFSDRSAEINLAQLQHLFNIGTFWAQGRKLEDLSKAISYSEPVISISDAEKLIGFARAISDGIYRATIWDVVIHPEYRGFGLGSELIKTVLNHPKLRFVERVYLMTTYQQGFYEKIGFQTNNSTTMVLSNPSHLDSFLSGEIQQLVR
jgi:N-acetylglutamate synthase-like GNAT family acetyltransferase